MLSNEDIKDCPTESKKRSLLKLVCSDLKYTSDGLTFCGFIN